MKIQDIKFNNSFISEAKINGYIVYKKNNNTDTDIDENVDLNLQYNNTILAFKVNKNGTYKLNYADNNGVLSNYESIVSMNLVANVENTYTYFNSLNVAPIEATKIALCDLSNNIIDSVELPNNLKINGIGQKLYSVGLLSDIHIDGNGDGNNSDSGNSQEDFKNALTYFNQNNVDFICIDGDITYYGYEADYQAYKTIVNQYSNNIPIKTIRGNHETYLNGDSNYSPTNNLFVTNVGNLYYSYITDNEDVFLFCGMNEESKSSPFSTDELNWLKSQVNQHKNNRIFLFVHYYYGETGNINGICSHSALTNQDFIDLITNCKNIIYFSGHTHLAFELQKYGANANVKFRDDICSRVHIPSLAKPRKTSSGSSGSGLDYGEGSEGYIMDVYENNIVLKGINFETNKIKPIATYLLDTTLIEYEDTPQEIEDSITVYPSSYNTTDYSYASVNSSYPLSNAVGKSSTNTSYSQWNIKTGSNAESWVYYNFDLSSIPENAVITSIECKAKAYISQTNSSRINTRNMQMYTGNTPKGSTTNLSTTATETTLNVENWTREELKNARLKIYTKRGTSSTTTTYYNRFYGATLKVNYKYTV